jgi:hypothetical protein
MESDVQNLRRHGLIEQRSIEGHESYAKQVFTRRRKPGFSTLWLRIPATSPASNSSTSSK